MHLLKLKETGCFERSHRSCTPFAVIYAPALGNWSEQNAFTVYSAQLSNGIISGDFHSNRSCGNYVLT